MKLVSFKKTNKQKKIIIGSIFGILLIIGSILLYRSYALYEEEKEFNVLKGQVPDFGYDIKMLSVVVDGEKSKTVPTRGLYKTQIECSNGTRGEWDYNAWNLTLENVSENARCNITFTSNLSEEEYNKYIEAGVALRRNTYRGKDITSYHQDGSLYEMITSGRFDDIYVGDYIKSIVNGKEITWLVADIDNYLYSGGTPLTKHHLTMIPSVSLMSAAMNDTNTTEGGYLNSKMVKETLPKVLSQYIVPVFKEHVLTYENILTNATDWEWVSRQLDLMSEANVFGISITQSSLYDVGLDNQQYAIFRLKPTGVLEDYGYWLKAVRNAESFARELNGVIINTRASLSFNVLPRFLIG